jgi:hypothetical protein
MFGIGTTLGPCSLFEEEVGIQTQDRDDLAFYCEKKN